MKREPVVYVFRDPLENFRIVSEVTLWPIREMRGGERVTIDRNVGNRGEGYIQSRARSLAKIIGCRYHEDLTFRCCAGQGFNCHCPKCVKWS